MPEKTYEWRKMYNHTTKEEIIQLRKDYSDGKSIKELKSGFFENDSEISIKNIINYKTYTNI